MAPGGWTRSKGNGTGIVAFDKMTGEVKYQITDELASYSSPRWRRSAAGAWCFVFARGGLVGFDPASGKVDFHFPWRATILESVNASNPVVVGDRVFISETYGPGMRCCKSSRAATKSSGPTPQRRREQGDANALEHADPPSMATCMAPAAGTPRTPNCGASSWPPAR